MKAYRKEYTPDRDGHRWTIYDCRGCEVASLTDEGAADILMNGLCPEPDAYRSTLLLTIAFLEELKDRFSNDGSNDFRWPGWVTLEYRKMLTKRAIAETRNPDEDVSGPCVQNTSVVYGLINHLKELAGPPP